MSDPRKTMRCNKCMQIGSDLFIKLGHCCKAKEFHEGMKKIEDEEVAKDERINNI